LDIVPNSANSTAAITGGIFMVLFLQSNEARNLIDIQLPVDYG